MPRYPGFIGPSYTSQSVVAADDQTVNWIPAKIESGTGTADYVFDPSPGFHLCVDGGHGLCQGSYSVNAECFMALGGTLVSVDAETQTAADLMSIPGTGDIVSITSNGLAGNQLMIARRGTVSGGTLSWYNLDLNTFGTIAAIAGADVVFLNGYFIALDELTSTIYVSALEDGTSWDPLDFLTRSDLPDNWRKMIVRSPDIFIFGSQTCSVLYNDPAGDFPFVPNTNITINLGIEANQSLCLLQGSPIWLANDFTVRYMQGYTPVRVSTHAIEYAIATLYPSPAAADGSVFYIDGHSLYVLTFPPAGSSPGGSWCYDLVSGLWHQLGTYDSDLDIFGPWPGTYAAMAQGFQIVGNRSDGQIYFMNQSYATELDGTTLITRRRRAPHIVGELKNIIYDRFQLFLEVGNAPAAGDGSDPMVTLQWSNDGGQTFNTGLTISAGVHDDFTHRVIWRKLGMARDRIFQITASDPLRLVDAFLEYRVGAS